MANYNLTAQLIKDSFEQLAQVSGSIEAGLSGYAVVDGTGSRIDTLLVTSSAAISASHALQADSATSASFATTALSASYAPGGGVTSIIAGTNITIDQSTGDVTINSSGGGGGSTDTGSLLVTASNVDATITYTKGDGSTFQNIINNVANATEAEDLVISVKNTSGVTLAQGTAVHAVSVTGENVNITAASNDLSSAMPAIGLLSEELTNNSVGDCIIAGRDTGLNTSGLAAGAAVYVSTGGSLTSTKPTGSALIQNIGIAAKINATEGEIIVLGSGRSNDLPNIANNHVWVGDSNSVPQATAVAGLDVLSAFSATSASYALSSSVVNDPNVAYINKNNTFTGTQSFNNISVAGTGSFGYLKTITGSATIIGDQYIVLNADSPTARFAGIKVYDSGSGLTGSFEWDSVDDNWIQVETGGTSAGILTGISGSKGSEAYPANNTILKGTGNHTIQNSNITDSGTIITLDSDVQANDSINFSTFVDIRQQGVNFLTGSTSDLKLRATNLDITDSSNNVSANFTNTGVSIKKGTQITGSLIVSQSGLSSGDDVFVLGAPRTGGSSLEGVIRSTVDDGMHMYGNKFFNNGSNTFSGGITGFESGPVQIGPAGSPVTLEFQNNSPIVASGGTLPITGSVNIQGAIVASGSYNQLIQNAASEGGNPAEVRTLEYGATTSQTGESYAATFIGMHNYGTDVYDHALTMWKARDNAFGYWSTVYSSGRGGGVELRTVSGSVGKMKLFTRSGTGVADANIVADEFNFVARDKMYIGNLPGGSLSVAYIGGPNITNFKLTASSSAAVEVQSSLEVDYNLSVVGDSTLAGTTVDGALTVTGSLITTGSIRSEVVPLTITSLTASVDPSLGTFFTLGLADGVNTHITNVNPVAGSTYTLKTTDGGAGTGTITFDPEFKFAGGTAPTATAAASAVDIYTFATYTTSEVYATAVQNLS